MGKNKGLHMVTFLLLVIGGLNWLLLGLFQWEIGMLFGGSAAIVSRIIYVLVGLSAIYELATHKANCKMCGGDKKKMDKPAEMPKSDMGSSDSMGGDNMGGSDNAGM